MTGAGKRITVLAVLGVVLISAAAVVAWKYQPQEKPHQPGGRGESTRSVPEESPKPKGRSKAELAAAKMKYDEVSEAYFNAHDADERRAALTTARTEPFTKALTLMLEDAEQPLPIRTRSAELLSVGDPKHGESVEFLVSLLSSDSKQHRKVAMLSLERIADRTFGFKHELEPQKQKKAIDKWKNWARERTAKKGGAE